MAGNQHYQRRFGVAKSSTWDTATSIVSTGDLAHLNQPGDSWSIQGGITRALEMSGNNNVLQTHDQRHAVTFNVNGQYNFTGQALQHLIAAMFGASTDSPAENNSGQADYAHEINLSAETTKHVTVAGMVESDQIVECTTAQPTSLVISGNQNDPIRIQVTGTGARRLTSYEASPTNTAAELAGMTYPSPDLAFCNSKTNLYCRINSQSGGALSGSDNVKIESFTYTVTRQPQVDYVFDTTNTGVCQIPKYPSPFSEHSFTITLDRLDDAYFDVFSSFQSGTYYKINLFCDGSQIGSGDNGSISIWLPKVQCITDPGAQSSQGTQWKPSLTFTCMEAASAPTGFPTGVTLGQIALVSTVSVDLA